MRALLLLVPLLAWAQEKPCPVNITVTNASSKQPLARPTVEFRRANSTVALSGSKGNLPAGEYGLYTSHAGYLPDTDRPVTCRTGEEIKFTVALTPVAVLAGRVTDENGQPMAGSAVTLLHWRYVMGERVWMQEANTTTDAGGTYRFSNLTPGRYQVEARPPAADAGVRVIPLDPEAPKGTYVATYYSGVTVKGQAPPITLRDAQEFPNADVRLRRVATFTVRGRVRDDSGTGPGSFDVRIAEGGGITNNGLLMLKMGTPADAKDGRFQITGVPPGSHLLTALKPVPGAILVGVTALEVNEDVSDVEVTLRPAITVSGAVKAESSQGILVSLQPLRTMVVAARSTVSSKEGAFLLEDVPAGRYRIGAMVSDALSYYAGFRWNGREYGPTEEVDLLASTAGIELFIKNDGGTITLNVTGTGNYPQMTGVCLPAEPKDRVGFLIRPMMCRERTCTSQNIPPGDYIVFALPGPRSFGAWLDPEWWKTNEDKMKRVTLKPKAQVIVEAPLLPE